MENRGPFSLQLASAVSIFGRLAKLNRRRGSVQDNIYESYRRFRESPLGRSGPVDSDCLQYEN